MAYPATLTGAGWLVGNIVSGATFSAHKNGVAQSIASDVETKVTFGTVLYNPDTVVNSRWTPPAGPVLLIGAVYMPTANNFLVAGIFKNGVEMKWGAFEVTTNPDRAATVIALDVADGDDYYELFVVHNTGTPQDINGAAAYTYFQGSALRM